MKIFKKIKKSDGIRQIYILGIKILSYQKKQALAHKLENLEKLIKADNNLIFKYLTGGIELHPVVACERVVIDNHNDVLSQPEIYPNYYPKHIYRYKFANKIIGDNCSVLDLACGTGYGSKMIAENETRSVVGGDISQIAVDFANKTNTKQNLSFAQSNALDKTAFEKAKFDNIISFETLEHVPEELMKNIIKNFYYWLKDDGIFIGSTPNEKVDPYTGANNFHFKHYTSEEIFKTLSDVGFKDIEIYYQDNDNFNQTDEKNIGKYLIFTAKKQ